MSHLTRILIGAGVVGFIFGLLWYLGYLVRIRNYVQQTREELRKCTWPTWDELKGSTVIVTLSIALLGGFIVIADVAFVFIINWITKV